jgi:pimeloyl-ACP methyl ester carboxylesterase
MTGDHRPTFSLGRREFLQATGLAVAAALPGIATAAPAVPAGHHTIVAEDHWARKGDVKLYIYRKHLADGGHDKPVLFLVHGSSFSGRGGFDLQVPGRSDYSMMDAFAAWGFDVWTMDHEGYGLSSRTGSNSDVHSGAADLQAALPVVEQVTGRSSVMMYGQSSGALRAGVFAMQAPERVERLVLDAFTYTGDGAPEIMRRRADVDTYRNNPSRRIDRSTFTAIFSRDDPSTFDSAVPEALAKYELALGNTVPSGTYFDMAANLPLVDPAKLQCSVAMIRAEHDGNATEAELLEFFAKLPNKDKEFHFVKGVAHVAVLGINRHRVWYVMREFYNFPPVRSA